MSDQCKHCTLREQFYNCRQADCFQHENWYAMEMIKENDGLRSLVAILERKNQELKRRLINVLNVVEPMSDREQRVEIAMLKSQLNREE